MRAVQFITLREANAYVLAHHRHNGSTLGHRMSLGVREGDDLVGCAIIGNPVARTLQNGWTAEVRRVCTGNPGQRMENGHAESLRSQLYAACWRVWRVGGLKLVTYALESESGSSLRAAGFIRVAKVEGRPEGWNRPGRGRAVDPICNEPKWRWEISRMGRDERLEAQTVL